MKKMGIIGGLSAAAFFGLAISSVALADGKEVWEKNCKSCHGVDAKKKMPADTSKIDLAKVKEVVRAGIKEEGKKMKAYDETKINAADLDAVAAYTLELLGKK